MAREQDGAVRFPRRVLGYDRRAVQAALESTQDQLRRAETRRDELLATTANVERIGAQVADMLRTLADRAVELEVDAAATAAQVVEEAHREAEQVRAQAAAVLADAEVEARQLVETARQQQAAIVERRETALISLQIAIHQMGRLATTIDEIDLSAGQAIMAPLPPPPSAPAAESPGPSEAENPDTVVLLPWGADAGDEPGDRGAQPIADDPIALALARIEGRARTS